MTAVEVHRSVAEHTQRVGLAYFTRERGRISTTFVYDTAYLAADGVSIDPALPLVAGSQYQPSMVRAFADTAPDRWGRNLIDKAERARSRAEQRTARSLDDLDYLLGVSDDTRQGALRFRREGQTDFLGPASTVPPLVSLPRLLDASDQVVRDDEPSAAIKQLLDTGTTGLGGARPKASVRLEDGALAIAKFPHASDAWDVMAWEATSLDLHEAAGIRTPARRLVRVGARHVLVLRRFDRTENAQRVGYISAMTATGSVDGEHRDYVDIADAIRDLSGSPRADLRELFSRVVVSVALGNTDDHLRNHGFLTRGQHWQLSPVFDVNPNPEIARPRATAVAGADRFPDEVDALLSFAEACDLSPDAAIERVRAVAQKVSDWRTYARSHRIGESEISMMRESIEPRVDALRRFGR